LTVVVNHDRGRLVWASDAVDEVRRVSWNDARKAARLNESRRERGQSLADAPACPDSTRAVALKHSRYAFWKNPENLTERQSAKLA
jgi:transposase